ncbi:MAG: hypothetical protein A3F84_16495 [Candidatus Handelsmanbacteria bacterium RIFCSPLOWO2_12_FULL_64_10]|uniref:Transposase IS200-like domain-containing protein n=1 Tax=Handelsmanbacteria sp. (strain RIFCSPLOWO2_12_FULL_64_10) TaxID=1817868 RepID=A0A1F6D312_HANXR|nr:MAG: hypothetical protein A3F84_16495 [Candidatus Handelsmanbacteria bacterium RIFCSPLOWO2_12_FULL_64_10]
MQPVTPLEPGHYYHIYNRGVNRTNIFLEDRNYAYFMQLYAKYIIPVADTFSYCLLRNHFHLLVRIKDEHDLPAGLSGLTPVPKRLSLSQPFSNLFNAYTKAINKAYGRTGALFQRAFGRLPVTSDRYFVALIHYIHCNPQTHGFVNDFREWPYSSYHALLSDKPTQLARTIVLDWFGGLQALRQIHTRPADVSSIRTLIGEDEA